jgi:hypothetical protein
MLKPPMSPVWLQCQLQSEPGMLPASYRTILESYWTHSETVFPPVYHDNRTVLCLHTAERVADIVKRLRMPYAAFLSRYRMIPFSSRTPA